MTNRKHIQNILQFKPSGFDPLVEQHYEKDDELHYGKWETYESQEHVDERSVFPNEVVIDIDEGGTEERRKKTQQVSTLLKDLPHFVADSGGTGFHIHLFFQLPEQADEARQYRLALFNWIKQRIDEEAAFDSEDLDRAPVDFDTKTGNGHLIRAVGGRHPETGNRKSFAPSLNKQEVEDADGVDFPVLNRQVDLVEISRIDDSKADLTWDEINRKSEEIEERQEKKREESFDLDSSEKQSGMAALRRLPASKVLELVDVDAEPGDQILCPCHDDNNPSAKITDGTEGEETPEELLFCFSDTCRQESDGMAHYYNAIDILTENGRSFQEAKQELMEAFDVDMASGSVSKYFADSENMTGFRPNRLAEDIEEEYEFALCSVSNSLYVYRNGSFDDDGRRLVKEECNRRLGDHFKKSRVENTISAIETRPGTRVEKCDFRPPEYKINLKNGVYDIRENELLDHSPEYMFTQQIPHDYNPDASCENINRFLREITESEAEAKTLKQLAGYAMLPNMDISAAFMLVGEGQNGKTMLINLLKQAIGEQHIKDEELQYLESNTFSTSSLYRKLMVVSDDLSSEELDTGSTLKAITGGGDVRAEFKMGDRFEFKNYATPLFACNKVPKTSDNTDGFFRRWTIIDFPYKFVKDPNENDPKQKQRKSEMQLEQDLYNDEELEGFVYESIEAVKEVFESFEFAAQKTSEATRKKWKSYADPLMEFIYKFVEQGTTYNEAERQAKSSAQSSVSQFDFDFIPKDELMALASAYCESHNSRPPKSKGHLKNKLDEAGFYLSSARTTQVSNRDGRTRVFRGIKYTDKVAEAIQQTESFSEFHTYLGISAEDASAYDVRVAHSRLRNNYSSKSARELVKNTLRSTDSGQVSYPDLLDSVDLPEDSLESVVETMKDDGEIFEPEAGELALL